jgi:hypothetical protein
MNRFFFCGKLTRVLFALHVQYGVMLRIYEQINCPDNFQRTLKKQQNSSTSILQFRILNMQTDEQMYTTFTLCVQFY